MSDDMHIWEMERIRFDETVADKPLFNFAKALDELAEEMQTEPRGLPCVVVFMKGGYQVTWKDREPITFNIKEK